MKTIDKNIMTFGLMIELTNSQTLNFEIIKSHWNRFNAELKKHNLLQNGGNCVKYGITIKTNETFFYLTTIPQNNFVFPEHFVYKEIQKANTKFLRIKEKWKRSSLQFAISIKIFYLTQVLQKNITQR